MSLFDLIDWSKIDRCLHRL